MMMKIDLIIGKSIHSQSFIS